MANLKAIRTRIRSVQATKKITSAMKMVAAAKVRRAQQRTLASRPFTTRVIKMIRELLREVQPIDLAEMPLLQHRPVKNVALLVITSDRGLCGSYNSSIIRKALERIRELEAEGKKASLIVVGLKGATFFRSLKVEKHKTYTLLPAIPTVEEAKMIAKQAEELFLNGTVDSVELLSTRFISMLRSEIVNFNFLPVELPPASEGQKGAAPSPIMLFDPGITEVLENELIPKYVENVIFQALLEASASELAARMNAMSNASTNAQELINSLTLVYNKARQASITQELLEVVAGAEALSAQELLAIMPQLSVIIPAYNEEHRLPATLESVYAYLNSSGRTFEVLVVDDGSHDRTVDVVDSFAAEHPGVRALSYQPNQGKGHALRTGIAAAKGDLLLIDDADGSSPIEELDRLERAIIHGADIAIGSRAKPDESRRVEALAHRKFIGNTFNAIVQGLVLPGLYDTQCGFKLFKSSVGKDIFSVSQIDGYGFDVEILYIARLRGYKIEEIAINWHNVTGSKVNVLIDSPKMFVDVLNIAIGSAVGRYRKLIETR